MSHAGFFEQKRGSPTGLALVVTAHAAVLGALVLIKGPEIIRAYNEPLVIRNIPVPPDPPANPPPKARELRPETTFTRPRRELDIPIPTGPAGPTTEARPVRELTLRGEEPIRLARIEPITPAIRREAQILSGNLQPPYPPDQQRAERGGVVRLLVHIGPNGRVVSVERLSATNDAFWNATQRHALARWRFRPATIDGRPVESTRTMTVHFRIEDI